MSELRLNGSPPNVRPSGAIHRPLAGVLALSLVFAAACVGTLEPATGDTGSTDAPTGRTPTTGGNVSPNGTPGGTTPTGQDPAPTPVPKTGFSEMPAASCTTSSFAPGAIRLLLPSEYANTIKALVASFTTEVVAFDIPEMPPMVSGFKNRIGVLELSADYTGDTIKNASRAAALIAKNRAKLHASCGEPVNESQCSREAILRLGKLAFRRPLTSPEETRFLQRFATLRQKWSFELSLQTTFQVLLTAPQFFHRTEIGQAVPGRAGVKQLSPYEVASALSYSVTQGPPDAALMRAADDGLLSQPSGIDAQLARLIDEKKTVDGLSRFFVDLLDIERVIGAAKDATAFPFFNASVSNLLFESFGQSAAAIVSSPTATISDFLTSRQAYVRKELGPMFDVSSTASTFAPQELGADRAGLFTHPAFLAAEADQLAAKPLHRARFVLQGALCFTMPDPPAEADEAKPPEDPTLTQRQKFSIMTSPALCTGCHKLLNPVSYAFEAFDAVGRQSTKYKNETVDPAGMLPTADGKVFSFTSARNLMEQFANDKSVRECFVSSWYTYLLGRDLTEPDNCSRVQSFREFERQEWKVRPLLKTIFSSDSFRFRKGV